MQDLPSIAALNIKVGYIVGISKHPDADNLFVQHVDINEDEPRTIVSSLLSHISEEVLQNSKVIVLCNMRSKSIRGIHSNGMLLCATDDGHTNVEPLRPPTDAVIGERVYFGTNKEQEDADLPNRVQKKRIWKALQPSLKIGEDGVARFSGSVMYTSAGEVRAPTFRDVMIG